METAADPVDLLVVGAGPVGLASALEAAYPGLSHVVIEKGALLDTLVHWPTYTVFFSTPELLEIGGHPFTTASAKPTRREGLVYYRKVAEREGLAVRLHERVLSVGKTAASFASRRRTASSRPAPSSWRPACQPEPPRRSRRGPPEGIALLHRAVRARPHGRPHCRGWEELGRGSGARPPRTGSVPRWPFENPAFGASVKYWLRPDIENRVKEGSVRALFETTVSRIEERLVVLETAGKRAFEIPNDFVFALTGYRPDFPLLRACGITVTDDLEVVRASRRRWRRTCPASTSPASWPRAPRSGSSSSRTAGFMPSPS